MTTTDLRARSWDEFHGQRALKERLEIHIQAAITDERPLPHVFLNGAPGFGKTTLAGIIASRLGESFESIVMPIKPKAFLEMFKRWGGGVLLLDELHRAPDSQQEDLLTLLEDRYLTAPSGKKIPVEWLTIIGATTEPEGVIPPLYDRFEIKPAFEEYSEEDMGAIVKGFAKKLGLRMNDEMANALGRAAGGTPRNARQLVLAARDLAHTQNKMPKAEHVLELCQVQPDGLTAQHMEYIKTLAAFDGSAGLKALSSHLRLHESVLRNLERLLVKHELITYTEKGRELTQHGFQRSEGRPVMRLVAAGAR